MNFLEYLANITDYGALKLYIWSISSLVMIVCLVRCPLVWDPIIWDWKVGLGKSELSDGGTWSNVPGNRGTLALTWDQRNMWNNLFCSLLCLHDSMGMPEDLKWANKWEQIEPKIWDGIRRNHMPDLGWTLQIPMLNLQKWMINHKHCILSV